MESFVITLREGVEAALIIGIIIAYLRRTGRAPLIGRVYWGLAGAILASIAAGFILPRLFRSVLNEETYEGVLMLLAAAMIMTLVIWMALVGKGHRAHLEAKMEAISSSAWAGWGVVLFAFLMIFREGAEVVLLVTVLEPGTDAIYQILGGIAGVFLAVAFGIGFVKGTTRVNLKSFFRVTAGALSVLALMLLTGGLHEFGEAGVIPVGPQEMALIGPIVNNNTWVFSAILLVSASLVFLGSRGGPAPETSNGPVLGGAAADRKRNWILRAERRWRLALGFMAVAFGVMLTAIHLYSQAPSMEPAQAILDNDGSIHIPLAELADGRMRFYEHTIGDESVRFFALRIGERHEVCLDACLICGPLGYYQQGPELICRNCSAPINLASVGLPGGCNPIPVDFEIRGGEIVVAAGSLHFP